MNWLFDNESHSDRCFKGRDIIQENASDLSEKDTGATKPEGCGNHFYVEEGSWRCGVYIVLIQRGGTKCATCKTYQLGHEGKLDVSVSADDM